MTDAINETAVEQAALAWFAELGFETAHGDEIAPGQPGAERQSYSDVVLANRLRGAIDRLNRAIPAQARDDAFRKVLRPESPSLIVNNRAFHRMLRDGVEVEYKRPDGSIAGDRVRLMTDDPAEAVAVMLEKYEICCDMLHGFNWSAWTSNNPAERLSLLPAAQEHVLAADKDDGKQRFCRTVYDLSRAFALCPTHDEATRIRDDIAFFQAVRAAFLKTAGNRRDPAELDQAIRQLISKAVTAGDEIIDVFSAAGIKKPDISILSDEFLADVKNLPHKNLAVDLLEKLLKGEIKTRRKKNIVQSRSFAEMLQNSLNAYHNRAITTQQVIDHLIQIAKEMRDAQHRGDQLGLNETNRPSMTRWPRTRAPST